METQIPISSDGTVRYHDCVYGICKVHYNVDDDGAKVAAKFVERDIDANTLSSVFMIQHAYAVRKIVRLLRVRVKRRKDAEAAAAAAAAKDAFSSSGGTGGVLPGALPRSPDRPSP